MKNNTKGDLPQHLEFTLVRGFVAFSLRAVAEYLKQSLNVRSKTRKRLYVRMLIASKEARALQYKNDLGHVKK